VLVGCIRWRALLLANGLKLPRWERPRQWGQSDDGGKTYADFGGMQSPHMNMRWLIIILKTPNALGLCTPHL
jgi:hypothetical protein